MWYHPVMSSSNSSPNPPVTVNVTFEGNKSAYNKPREYPYRVIFTLGNYRDDPVLSAFTNKVFNTFIGEVFSEGTQFARVVAGSYVEEYKLGFIVKSLDGCRELLAKVSEALSDVQIDHRCAVILDPSPKVLLDQASTLIQAARKTR